MIQGRRHDLLAGSAPEVFFCSEIPELEVYQMLVLLIVLSTVLLALLIQLLDLWPRD